MDCLDNLIYDNLDSVKELKKNIKFNLVVGDLRNEKLIEDQEFTDDEDDKAIRSQLEKEKEALI